MSDYAVVNPATGETIKEYPTITDDALRETIARADDAYRTWTPSTTAAERGAIIRKVADLHSERREELAAIIVGEMGKPVEQALMEVDFAAEIYGFYADNADELMADEQVKHFGGDGTAIVRRSAFGTLLGIMPWNFPYYQVARFAGPNIVIGNPILLKHAPQCPESAEAIQQIFDDAGAPAGVYNNVFATNDQVEWVIGDPRVHGVSVTGSERAGAAVAEIAGRNLKKVVLELGGSDPYIILDTADVATAAETAWTTRMENVGQACNSNKRMIVMEDVYDAFVASLAERAAAMTPRQAGDDSDQAYSPMVSRAAAENLKTQLDDAIAKGATLVTGGELAETGAYFAPAVLTGVTPDMRAYSEELFGPVAVVYKVSSDDEAVRLANVVDFGLGGAVFSTDEERATRVAEQLEVGMANVNTPAGEGADLPFGGTKRSGFGRELGPLGIDEFVNKRLFYVED